MYKHCGYFNPPIVVAEQELLINVLNSVQFDTIF